MAARECTHTDLIKPVQPRSQGCAECVTAGDTWTDLRICVTCGEVSCCDTSKNRHASRHAAEAGHPIVESFEHGESWRWCYEDRLYL